MQCPHCGVDHKEGSPCNPATSAGTSSSQPRIKEDPHPLAGLDNPFWKPEKPAAAGL